MIYINKNSFYATAQSEPLPVDYEYLWRKVRRGMRRVGYGLVVGHSMRTVGGAYCVAMRTAYYYYMRCYYVSSGSISKCLRFNIGAE